MTGETPLFSGRQQIVFALYSRSSKKVIAKLFLVKMNLTSEASGSSSKGNLFNPL